MGRQTILKLDKMVNKHETNFHNIKNYGFVAISSWNIITPPRLLKLVFKLRTRVVLMARIFHGSLWQFFSQSLFSSIAHTIQQEFFSQQRVSYRSFGQLLLSLSHSFYLDEYFIASHINWERRAEIFSNKISWWANSEYHIKEKISPGGNNDDRRAVPF